MNKTNKFKPENIEAQMRKGSLEFTILLIISRDEAYASDILQELKTLDLIVVEGTLYPILSRLNRGGLLDYKWIESDAGPPRKYYTLTVEGKKTLEYMIKVWEGLSGTIQGLIYNYNEDIHG